MPSRTLFAVAPVRRGLTWALPLLVACRADPSSPEGRGNPDWAADTHGAFAAPAYGTVFPQTAVNTLDIAMTAEQWASVQANMLANTGTRFGAGAGVPGGGGVPGGVPGGAPGTPRPEPAYIDVTVTFNGKRWHHVGFRLKGNSSLNGAWRQGNYKLPFRLHFDRFEDQYPKVDDQRFYGFRELSMSPGWNDASLLREKLASDLFRAAGIPSARTAFYRVFVDFGTGRRYVGVYTMVEVIDDTMVRTQFGSDAGNIYKPESNLRSFAVAQFAKKNNEAAADYRDVQALVTALNDPIRTTDPAKWRAGLEAVFDVPHYLKLLAVNNAMVNWDTYGAIAHNYYLYNHPTRKLVWLPWDLNQAMEGSPGVTGTPGAGGAPGPGANRGLSLSMNEATATAWPLLRFIADDPLYLAAYKAQLKEVTTRVFTPAAVAAMIDANAALIAPFVVGVNGEQPGATYLPNAAAFTGAHAALKAHAQARRDLISSWVP